MAAYREGAEGGRVRAVGLRKGAHHSNLDAVKSVCVGTDQRRLGDRICSLREGVGGMDDLSPNSSKLWMVLSDLGPRVALGEDNEFI